MNNLYRNQKGFALMETLIAVAVIGTIATTFSGTIFDIFTSTERNNAYMSAACNIENASRLISIDGQMAQSSSLIPGESAINNINLTWTDPANGNIHEVYYYQTGDNLQRRELLNSIMQNEKSVAVPITSIFFSQPVSEERLFTFIITSSGGSSRVSETKEYHVTCRAIN